MATEYQDIHGNTSFKLYGGLSLSTAYGLYIAKGQFWQDYGTSIAEVVGWPSSPISWKGVDGNFTKADSVWSGYMGQETVVIDPGPPEVTEVVPVYGALVRTSLGGGEYRYTLQKTVDLGVTWSSVESIDCKKVSLALPGLRGPIVHDGDWGPRYIDANGKLVIHNAYDPDVRYISGGTILPPGGSSAFVLGEQQTRGVIYDPGTGFYLSGADGIYRGGNNVVIQGTIELNILATWVTRSDDPAYPNNNGIVVTLIPYIGATPVLNYSGIKSTPDSCRVIDTPETYVFVGAGSRMGYPIDDVQIESYISTWVPLAIASYESSLKNYYNLCTPYGTGSCTQELSGSLGGGVTWTRSVEILSVPINFVAEATISRSTGSFSVTDILYQTLGAPVLTDILGQPLSGGTIFHESRRLVYNEDNNNRVEKILSDMTYLGNQTILGKLRYFDLSEAIYQVQARNIPYDTAFPTYYTLNYSVPLSGSPKYKYMISGNSGSGWIELSGAFVNDAPTMSRMFNENNWVVLGDGKAVHFGGPDYKLYLLTTSGFSEIPLVGDAAVDTVKINSLWGSPAAGQFFFVKRYLAPDRPSPVTRSATVAALDTLIVEGDGLIVGVSSVVAPNYTFSSATIEGVDKNRIKLNTPLPAGTTTAMVTYTRTQACYRIFIAYLHQSQMVHLSWTTAISSLKIPTFGAGGLDSYPDDTSFPFVGVVDIPPVITTGSPLPNAPSGTPYVLAIGAAGGITPYSWMLTSGALPSGITLSSLGIITGSSTAIGTYTFDVTVTTATGKIRVKTLELTVV